MEEVGQCQGLNLTPDERVQYETAGFFTRPQVFGEHELSALRAAAERVALRAEERIAPASSQESDQADYLIDGHRYIEAATSTIQVEHAPGSRTARVIEPFAHLDAVFESLIADSRIVRPLCGVLGEKRIALWTDKLNLKRPREGSGFRWHQDSPYWSHACGHCDRLPNVMVTLDDADQGNGCFRLIPGSHREGLLPGTHDGTRLGPLFTDPKHFDLENQWVAELPAGSLVVFSAHIVHGSESNRSDRPRRAIILTYQPPGEPMFKREGTLNFSA